MYTKVCQVQLRNMLLILMLWTVFKKKLFTSYNISFHFSSNELISRDFVDCSG